MSRDELPTAAPENEYGFAARRIESVRTVRLVEIVTTEGNGRGGNDYVRRVARYYTPEGLLVAVGEPSGASGVGV